MLVLARGTTTRVIPARVKGAAAMVAVVLTAHFYGQGSAAQFPLQEDLIGTVGTHVVTEEETLLDIARQHELGYVELRAANPGIDPWLPGDETRVLLPTAHLLPDAPRRGIVINLADQRLYYFSKGARTVLTFPIGTPRDGAMTPIGTTTIVNKRPNPTWFPPPSLRAENPDLPLSVPPGPDNPLGAFALSLAWPSYVIHGTNKPDGVGRRVSHGCIRLYPESIETLYPMVPVGTLVTTVDQPVKVGMAGGALYLEVHPSQGEIDEVEASGAVESPAPLGVETYVRAKAGAMLDQVDWALVERTARERRGLPVRIAR